jgi:hemerythrin
MIKIEWDGKLETGIQEIDAQHRELIKRIEELSLAIYGAKAKVQLVMMLEYLEGYVDEHFDTEEDMMMKIGYPDFSAHFEEHKKFRIMFERIKKEYLDRGATNYLAMELEKEIIEWFRHHLMEVDAAYVPYFKMHGNS